MSEIKHLERFEVENFKCFNKLVLEDIGQFNIFLGDNNVGKTTLLEALLFEETNYAEHMNRLVDILLGRSFFNGDTVPNFGDINIVDYFINKTSHSREISYKALFNDARKPVEIFVSALETSELTQNEINELNKRFKLYKKASKIYKIRIDSNLQIDYVANIVSSEDISYWPYIRMNLGYDEDMIGFYSRNISGIKERRDTFIENLKLFIPTIENVELSLGLDNDNSILVVWTKDFPTALPLPAFGEGTIKLFRILAELTVCRNNRLMIDEIDTGIHFSKFVPYWKTILKSASNNNVQLFSTTHSLECLKYFTQALEEDEMQAFREKARIYTLFKNREGNIEAIPHRFEQFEHAINNEIELRK